MLSYVILALLTYVGYYYWKVSKYPKGPIPLPFVGNIFQITELNNIQPDLQRWRKKYGNVLTFWVMDRPMVILMRLDEIKEALITKADIFNDRTGEFPEEIFQVVENGGVIFASGDDWREQRRMAVHILRDFGVGKNVMEQQIHEQCEHFVEAIRNIKNKDMVNFRTPIQILVVNIINQLLYGFSYPHNDSAKVMKYADTITDLFPEMMQSLFFVVMQAFPKVRKLPLLSYYGVRKYTDKFNWCLDFVKSDVKDSLANYDVQDEPNCFVQAYKQKMESNLALSMGQLYNVCSDFFLAGMETTTTTLRWSVLYLAKYQDVQEKVRKEIAKVVGFNRLPSLRDKNKMLYTTACLAELQRYINLIPIGLMRKTNKDSIIGGCSIPSGSIVVPNINGANIDETRFENPDTFNPDRFLNNDGTLNSDLISQTVPFSIGKRQCAGEGLARAELFLIFATIIQKFKLFPPIDTDIDLTKQFGLVIFPKDNVLQVKEVDPLEYI